MIKTEKMSNEDVLRLAQDTNLSTIFSEWNSSRELFLSFIASQRNYLSEVEIVKEIRRIAKEYDELLSTGAIREESVRLSCLVNELVETSLSTSEFEAYLKEMTGTADQDVLKQCVSEMILPMQLKNRLERVGFVL